MNRDCWCTVSDLRSYIEMLPSHAKVYVEMPNRMTKEDLENANLHEPFEEHREVDGTSMWVRAWGPRIKLNEDALYLEIYY